MNKGKILNFILARYEYEDTLDDELLESIRETIEEMQIAQCMFNYVNDPKLIEAAIYREDAAKKKFEYLCLFLFVYTLPYNRLFHLSLLSYRLLSPVTQAYLVLYKLS